MNEQVDRLSEFLKVKNISKSEFADQIGIGRPNISHIFSGRYGISDKVLSKIFSTYKDLNHMWLLFGNGNMLKDIIIENTIAENTNLEEQTEPLLNLISEQIDDENTTSEIEGQYAETALNNDKIMQQTTRLESKNEEIAYHEPAILERKQHERKIRKIVFFYDDKTFEEYYPE